MRVVPLAMIVFAAVLATLATILYVSARGEKLRVEAALAQAEARIRTIEPDTAARKSLSAALETQGADLSQTRQRLSEAQTRIKELEDSVSQGRNVLMLRQQNETLLNQEIAGLKRLLALAELQAQELAKCKARISELEDVLALLHRKGIPINPNAATPPATVLGIGPDNSFVIINLGSKQGIRIGQKLLVRRGTDVIATVLTSEVRDVLCVAQVDPFQLREALRKGDSILLDQ